MSIKKQIQQQREENSDATQTISDLSLRISMLKKKVQDQKQEIVRLSEKNAKLNNSDLKLKEAERLKEQAEQDIRTTSTLVSDFEKHKKSVITALDDRETAISEKEDRINAIESDLEGEIRERVNYEVYVIECRLEKEYRVKSRDLRNEIRTMKESHYIGYCSSIIGIIIFSLGTMATSKPWQKDAIAFFKGLFVIFKSMVVVPFKIGKSFGGTMFEEASSPIGYWIVGIIVMLVLYGLILFVIARSIWFLIENFSECLCDDITVVVLIVINGIPLFFASLLVETPINLLLMPMIAFTVYAIIRFLIAWDNQEQKKYNMGLILTTIASALLIFGLFKLVSC